MADLKTFLMEQGLTAEEIAGMSEKQQKAFGVALGRFDEGTAALTKSTAELETARKEREEAADFWEKQVIPGIEKAKNLQVEAASKQARMAARNIELAKMGYEVPADVLEESKKTMEQFAPNGTQRTEQPRTEDGRYVTPDQMGKEFRNVAPAMVSLVALSNEYQDLYGAPYVNADADYEEAQKARKPLRDFVREKYDFAGKKAAREAKKQEDLINQKADEKFKAREAELVARYGENADLRSPVASKFDSIASMKDHNKDSWKTSKDRLASRKDRLKRFENIVLQ